MVNMSKSDLTLLESMIDRYALSGTTEALAHIASEKAEHIRENWQDNQTAKVWDDAAKRLDGVSAKITV